MGFKMKRFIELLLFPVFFVLFSCSPSQDVASLNQNFTLPELIKQPRIYYPKEAQDNQLFGKVEVLLTINDSGKVINTTLLEKSDYAILDNAALNYCKDFVFSPGKIDGNPVYSKISYEVVFNLNELTVEFERYVQDVQSLYNLASETGKASRMDIEKKILDEHSKFIETMKDAENFNNYIKNVLKPEITETWKEEWNSWPLTFLLYLDFSERFSDYEMMPELKSRILESLKEDLKYIRKDNPVDKIEMEKKVMLLKKIRDFVSDQYSVSEAADLGL